MKYKLICSDLDDTLIGRNQLPGNGLRSAIAEYKKLGGRFCIVTGRMTVGALPLARQLDLHGEIITYQGAVMSDIDDGKIYFSRMIDNEAAVKIGEFIESKGYYYQTYIGDEFFTATPNHFTVLYGKLSHADYVKVNGALSEYLRATKANVPKILIMDEPERVPIIMEELRQEFGKEYLINTSKPFIIEIVPHGINKGLAVKMLADKYGIKQEEIICVGDSENDITMLSYAGLGICVKNGSEIAKKNSDVIAPDCDDDAVAWVINNYGLR